VTLAATVLLDLTQAIIIGFGISTLIFMAQMSQLQITRRPVEAERLPAHSFPLAHPGHDVAVYYLSGPLFFAAARQLLEFVETRDGPDAVLILSIRGVPLADATGVEVLRELYHRQQAGGGDLLLASMDARVETLLRRTGFLDEIGPDRVFWSTDRAIMALGAKQLAKPEAAADAAAPAIVEAVMMAPFAETMGQITEE
jgi:sulfate permease, SulP family